MATANDLIAKAFTKAGIRAAETALEADEVQDGLDELNNMLAEWQGLYQLGGSPVADVSDEVRIPRYADSAVIYSLAVRLAPEFSRPVSPALAATASTAFKNMLNNKVIIGDVDMPSTLPLGTGNECNDGASDSRFFPQKSKSNF